MSDKEESKIVKCTTQVHNYANEMNELNQNKVTN